MLPWLARGLLFLAKRPIATTAFTAATAVGVDHQFNDGDYTAQVTDEVTERIGGAIDDKMSDSVYDYIIGPLGVDRDTYDEWWEKLDPTALAGTYAAIQGVDLAIQNTIGIDLLSFRQALMVAVAYHFITNFEFEGKTLINHARDFLSDQGVIAPRREDDHGFNDAADARPTEAEPRTPEPETPEEEPHLGM